VCGLRVKKTLLDEAPFQDHIPKKWFLLTTPYFLLPTAIFIIGGETCFMRVCSENRKNAERGVTKMESEHEA